jgi:hypothetical protein
MNPDRGSNEPEGTQVLLRLIGVRRRPVTTPPRTFPQSPQRSIARPPQPPPNAMFQYNWELFMHTESPITAEQKNITVDPNNPLIPNATLGFPAPKNARRYPPVRLYRGSRCR